MSDTFSQLPRPDLEAKITAMVLGELSPAEAAELKAWMAKDAELLAWQQRLERTLIRVREAVANPGERDGVVQEVRRMSEARRDQLLKQLRQGKLPAADSGAPTGPSSVIPVQFDPPCEEIPRPGWGSLTLAAALVVMLLGAWFFIAPEWGDWNPQMVRLESRDVLLPRLQESKEVPNEGAPAQGGSFHYGLRLQEAAKPPVPQRGISTNTRGRSVVARGFESNSERSRDDGADNALGFTVLGSEVEAPKGALLPDAPGANPAQAPARFREGERVPVLGDLPSVGRLMKVKPEEASREADASAGVPIAGEVKLRSLDRADSGTVGQTPRPSVAAAPAEAKDAGVSVRRQVRLNAAPTVNGLTGGAAGLGGAEATLEKKVDVAGRAAAAGRGLSFGAAEIEQRSSGEPPLAERLADQPAGANQFFLHAGDSLNLSTAATETEVLRSKEKAGKPVAGVTELTEASPTPSLPPPPPPAPLRPVQAVPFTTTERGEAPIAQAEVSTEENAFSTFSLNVTDVSWKLADASLANGVLPTAAGIRSEEFLNAFEYHDPQPAPGATLAFAWDRARDPFSHGRDLLRLAVKTASIGRNSGRALNLVLVIDNSGSMERADRVAILRECLRVLAGKLEPNDRISVVAFARTARLWVDGLSGSQAGELTDRIGTLAPEGGTNLEEALRTAYETALKHFITGGGNRVILLTDGAANLGEVRSDVLRQMVVAHRAKGVALDCFGIGWEGYNDEVLEALSRNGDGRYGFVNTPEEATAGFATQLAGALQVAAADVKVQVEFHSRRVASWRQIGYAKHQLTREQFRDNTVDAAEIGAEESGNALYAIDTLPGGDGPVATVRVRYREPATGLYREHAWEVPYTGLALPLHQSKPGLRLAVVASLFAERLAESPYAAEVTVDRLLGLLTGVPAAFAPDPRPGRLEWMIRQAGSLGVR